MSSTASEIGLPFANTRSPNWRFHFIMPVLCLFYLCSLLFHTTNLIPHHT
jgi:hypothetical protein